MEPNKDELLKLIHHINDEAQYVIQTGKLHVGGRGEHLAYWIDGLLSLYVKLYPLPRTTSTLAKPPDEAAAEYPREDGNDERD